MPLLGNSKQNKEITLEEFYRELAANEDPVSSKIGDTMLNVIGKINDMFKQTVIWGLTSHYHLVLQNEDNWKSDWLVKVICIGTDEYYVEYLVPKNKAPWENAYVKGVAQNLPDAVKYLLLAMKQSNGWSENSELQLLLTEHGL